jgi:hypothetical protein
VAVTEAFSPPPPEPAPAAPDDPGSSKSIVAVTGSGSSALRQIGRKKAPITAACQSAEAANQRRAGRSSCVASERGARPKGQ